MTAPSTVEVFRRDGFVRVPFFFSQEEIAALRSSIQRYIETRLAGLPAGDYVLEADGKTVRNLWRMHEHDPAFLEWTAQQKLIDLAGPLVQGKPILMGVETFNKPAKVGSGVPYHQDNAYFCLAPPDALTVWIALDPARISNGAVYYLPGSHRFGTFVHEKSGVQGNSMGLVELPKEVGSDEVCAELEPGDILLHHCQTIHRSEPNLSEDSRLACLMVFKGEHTAPDPVLKARYD
jgi:ectoine hydroxylase-related dioxygenase (phytanoyl-CoA dioxygenase family)